MMNDEYARVIQVIETDLTRRGDGVNDPVRRVKQYWDLEGNLLAEVDPKVNDECRMMNDEPKSPNP